MKKLLNDNQKTEYMLSRREIFWLVFGAILFHWGLNYLDQFFGLIAVFTGIVFPFLLGGGIAFLLNLPMRFIERWLHIGLGKLHLTSKRFQKAVRPVSILLTLAIVGSVISGIAAVVIPQVSGQPFRRLEGNVTPFKRLTAGRGRRRVASFPVDRGIWTGCCRIFLRPFPGFLGSQILFAGQNAPAGYKCI